MTRRMHGLPAWAETAIWTFVAGFALLVAMIGGLGLALLAAFAVVFGANG